MPIEEGIVPLTFKYMMLIAFNGNHASVVPATRPNEVGSSHEYESSVRSLTLMSPERESTDACFACAAIVSSSRPSSSHVAINREIVGLNMAELFKTSLAKGVVVGESLTIPVVIFADSLLFVKHRVST